MRRKHRHREVDGQSDHHSNSMTGVDIPLRGALRQDAALTCGLFQHCDWGFIMLTTENTLALVIDFQARLMPIIRRHERLARTAATFVRGCRILGVPVLATQQYTKGLGDTVPELAEALGEQEFVEKITFSCYRNEEFKGKLESAGKKNILVTGIEAHVCVQQTVLDLLDGGYSVYVIADCIGSRFKPDRAYAERRMERAGAVLTTTESALFEMMVGADHPRRKEISSLVK